ncbi:uncharacterized protein TNIN_475021 [Trichonephila inaurata madagascariensis]|uniref:Uncharacterized protein n=1 Tax=Trichonephila inaurata madagascariensis TaxID=2747483 RepID=A0A8X6YU58_9ARAC|nr:uncharacterized protein TNIN_475021 [Trichonephila inaurata madagascariensis]
MFVTVLGFVLVLSPLFSTSNGTPCSDDEFPCNDGACIDTYLWCDSNRDCSDGSDEAYCRKITFFDKNPNKCTDKFFKCHDGPCIPLSGRCDGYFSCSDNSDEKDCPPEVILKIKAQSRLPRQRRTILLMNLEAFILNLILKIEKARRWIVSQRLDTFGWGSETPRALTALYLSDVNHSKRNETDMLMVKQLEVQLSLDIARNGTKSMALTDLALYINALMASSVYLTLCLNNFTAYEDVRRLHEILYSRNAALDRIDIQALSMLTAACAFRSNKSITAETYEGFKRQFIAKLKSKNFTGNIYEAALVMQALNEARLDEMEWKRSDLKKFLLTQQHEDGSFGCILATYLVLPIFSGSSLLKLGEDCNIKRTTGLTPIEVLKNTKRRKIPVQYSLNFGNPTEVTQILQIQVAEETNFLDIMRLAQEFNPKYRFLLDDTQEIPVVYSIGDIPNDAEKGMFWTLHVASANNRPRSDVGRLVPYLGNIKELLPKAGDELVFWMRSI